MIGPLGRLEAADTLRQHCPQMTQRRCKATLFLSWFGQEYEEKKMSQVIEGRGLTRLQ